MKEELKNIIESLLFVAEDPLTIERIKSVVDAADATEIKNALMVLGDEYEARGGGFYLSEVAGGYQIRTRPAYTEWIKRLIKPNPLRLSKAALETLAIIAYKQPIIRSDVEHIRGVDCGGVLRMLMERKLVRVLGRKEIPGRPLIYATTKHFLEVFELKNLKELPTPKEIEALAELSEDKTDSEHTRETGEDLETDELPIGDDRLETDENADTADVAQDPGSDDGIEAGDTSPEPHNPTVSDDSETEGTPGSNHDPAADDRLDGHGYPGTESKELEKTLDLDKDPPI